MAPAAPQGAPGGSGRLGTSGADASPLGAQPRPWVPELAAAKVFDSAAFDHPGWPSAAALPRLLQRRAGVFLRYSLDYIRLQPRLHTVTASTTCAHTRASWQKTVTVCESGRGRHGCSLGYIRLQAPWQTQLQPRLHMVTGSLADTVAASRAHELHAVAASIAYGCSLCYMRWQPRVHAVAGFVADGCGVESLRIGGKLALT